MPELILSACSQLVSVDRFTNTLSLFNIIEQINAPTFPFVMPQIFVASIWQRSDAEQGFPFESHIFLLDPSGKTRQEWKADWVFDQPRHRHLLLAANIEFESPGNYVFKIFINKKNEPLAEVPAKTIELPVQIIS